MELSLMLLFFGGAAGAAACAVLVIHKLERPILARRRAASGRGGACCPRCFYSLAGIPSAAPCPECGSPRPQRPYRSESRNTVPAAVAVLVPLLAVQFVTIIALFGPSLADPESVSESVLMSMISLIAPIATGIAVIVGCRNLRPVSCVAVLLGTLVPQVGLWIAAAVSFRMGTDPLNILIFFFGQPYFVATGAYGAAIGALAALGRERFLFPDERRSHGAHV